MTITTYTTAPVNGPESDVDYDRLEDAVAVAQQRGLQVIARHYVFDDSELIGDFTQYHWVVTAREPNDDEYLPDGPDACFDSPDEALDNLVHRLTRAQRELEECETGVTGAAALEHTIDGLLNRDVDVDHDGFASTVAADPDLPITYRITKLLLNECDGTNHR